MMDTARGSIEAILGVGTDTNDKFWIQGDDARSCYGRTIGSVPHETLIDLQNKHLVFGADTSDTSWSLDWKQGHLANRNWEHKGTGKYFWVRGTEDATDSESGAIRSDGGIMSKQQQSMFVSGKGYVKMLDNYDDGGIFRVMRANANSGSDYAGLFTYGDTTTAIRLGTPSYAADAQTKRINSVAGYATAYDDGVTATVQVTQGGVTKDMTIKGGIVTDIS